jgi:hypothetical protein
LVLIGLGSAIAAVTACSAPDLAREEAEMSTNAQASSVVVESLDAKGTSVASCSGTLLSSKLVLTAGHCIAGASKWKITSTAGTSAASVASTPWKNFGSDRSHPEHSDIGLILLDGKIELDEYPQIASSPAKEGSMATRFRRESASAKEATPTNAEIGLGADKGFRLNYLVETKDAWLDTGGAVLDSSGKIIGVVSGKGKQSGLLHIARVDGFATWAKSATSCASGLATRTWGSGNSQNGGGGYGGTPNTGGWGSSSGGYGGGGSPGGMMDGGATVPGSDGGTPGGDSTPGGNTSGGPTGDGGASSDGPPGGNSCPGTPTCSGGDCGAGSNGNNGGSGSGDGENCSGSGDNPDTCPKGPDSASCKGPNCGGCGAGQSCADSNVDYGGCASCGGGGSGPIVR